MEVGIAFHVAGEL